MVDYSEIVQGGDEAALRAFIAAHTGNVFAGTEYTQVFIGQLPTEEPLHSLPIPPQTQVAGSIVQQQPQLLLISELAPADVKAFYVDAISKMDWQPAAGGHMRTGFFDTQTEVFNYCNEARHQTLFGYIQAIADRTYIRITVSKSMNPCNDPQGYMKYMTAIPNLSAPQGVSLLPSSFSSGSTGGMDHFEARTSAVARWSGTLADLYQAYVPLLESVDWQMHTESLTDKAAVSWWDVTLDDETWQGVFSVLAKPKSPDLYVLMLTLGMSVA
ncbi:MAG: hypothetical protein CL607_19825 [Anaerolineaceae bacterium]|nr:hypothetical protein [Anaerolineaceae bacterium]